MTQSDSNLNKKTYYFILWNVFVFLSLNEVEQSTTSDIFHDNNDCP
jgi:hypothetical protein